MFCVSWMLGEKMITLLMSDLFVLLCLAFTMPYSFIAAGVHLYKGKRQAAGYEFMLGVTMLAWSIRIVATYQPYGG